MPSANPAAALLATWFGCGYSPVAPGTIGSIAAVAIAAAAGMDRTTLLAAAALLTPPSIWASTQVARARGKDPQVVVVDEVLGQWLTLAGATVLTPVSLLLGFALFRLFDIAKPWPIRRLEALPDGTGIIADDLGAGLLGALVLFLAGWFNFY